MTIARPLAVERHVAHGELEILAELRAAVVRIENSEIRRADRIGDARVDVALVDVDVRVALDRLGDMCRRASS